MKLRLETALEPEVTVKQAPEARLEQRAALEHRQVLRLTAAAAETRDSVFGPDTADLKKVLEAALADVYPGQKDLVKAFDEHLLAAIIARPEAVANGDESHIRVLIAGELFDMHRGRFQMQAESGGFPVTLDISRARATFIDAIHEPDKLTGELKLLYQHLRTASAAIPVQGAQERINELVDTQAVAAELKEYVVTVTELLSRLILYKPSGQDISPLADYLRELVFLQKAEPIIAERTLRRFADKARGKLMSDARRFENGFLNTLAEYLLVSMGVVQGDLFRLGSIGLESGEYRELKTALAKEGIDLEKMLDRYNLKSAGTIFYHRWAVRGVKLGHDTDDAVRHFVTSVCRDPQYKILQSLNYEGFFAGLKSALRDETDPILRRAVARDQLVQLLDSQQVRDFLRQLCKDKLYPELSKFYLGKAGLDVK